MIDFINYIINIDMPQLIEMAQHIGPILGILLPIIEAFFPFLPLVLFVTLNITVYGPVLGYIYSWIGNCLGSLLLFLLLKKIGGRRLERRLNNSKYKNAFKKIKERDFSVLFTLYCFPFAPSFLLSGTSALTNMNTKEFLIIMLPSKLIMLVSLALIGSNLSSVIENPIRTIIIILVIVLMNFVIKKVIESSNLLK